MTKNIFIVAIAVLLSVAFCSLSAQNVSKDYNVGDFSAINLQSVGNIIFAQSAECTCRLEGPSEFVEKTRNPLLSPFSTSSRLGYFASTSLSKRTKVVSE